MKPNPHLEHPLGRDDIPAVRSALSSRFPQFGQMKNGTSVSVARGPRLLRLPLEEARGRALGDRKPEMLEPALGDHTAARGPLEQSLLKKIRLVDVLDRVLL